MEYKRIQDETAIVLDFLPNGYPFDKAPAHKKTPIVQAIGTKYFTLIELVPKSEVHLNIHDEVYIGPGKRDKIHNINGRIAYNKLTRTAVGELEFVIKDIISKQEARFVDFFNTSRPLSMRMHQLELLPGLGKKHMWEIIEERKGKPYASFEDIKARVKLISDVQKLILARVMKEISGDEKHHLFTD